MSNVSWTYIEPDVLRDITCIPSLTVDNISTPRLTSYMSNHGPLRFVYTLGKDTERYLHQEEEYRHDKEGPIRIDVSTTQCQ